MLLQPLHSQVPSITNSSSHGNANNTWIPDSGASFHVTGEPQNIKQFSHFDGLDQILIGNCEGLSISAAGSSSFVSQILIGNGEGLSISAAGSSSFVSPNDSQITIKLQKLLHVPSITKFNEC